MNIFSDLLDNVFRQTNGFVIHVVLARFASAFIKQYATRPQILWFSKKFSNLQDDSINYYNMACTIKLYEYDDLEAIAESHLDSMGSTPEGINEAFATVTSTDGRGSYYLQLLDKVSPFKGTRLKQVIDDLILYLVDLESYKNSVLNDSNQLNYEMLHDDLEEVEEFRENWDDLIASAIRFIDACIAADEDGLIATPAIKRLIREIRSLSSQFTESKLISHLEPSSIICKDERMLPSKPTVMFSYSHDNEEHKKWVRDFATALGTLGITVILDQWDLKLGQDKFYFMESLVRADNVVIVCTPNYKQKADGSIEGGVNTETQIIRPEVYGDVKATKFIPLLRSGTEKTGLPIYLKSRMYVRCIKDEERISALQQIAKSVLKIPNSIDIFADDGLLSGYLKP